MTGHLKHLKIHNVNELILCIRYDKLNKLNVQFITLCCIKNAAQTLI